MRDALLEKLLLLVQVRGADEPAKEGDPPKKEQETPPKEEEEEENEEEEEETPKEKDTAGLMSALNKERKERKRLEKEAKTLRQFKDDKESENATEAQKATKKAEAAEAKTERLAKKLRTQALDIAIAKYAGNLKFRDVNDALTQIRREDDWIDQDEDEPSEIEVDEGAVEKAVKKLAGEKKYLLEVEGEELPSGSKFGGGKNKNEEMDEAALRDKYSALRRRSSST